MSEVTALTIIPEPSPKMGRPTVMTPEVQEEIVERLATGEPLARICQDDRLPSYATVRRWERENSDFQAHSAPARDDGRAYMMDECKEIADDPGLDPQDKRIRIETRMRLAGQWARSQVDVTSAGKQLAPQPVVFAAVFPSDELGSDT